MHIAVNHFTVTPKNARRGGILHTGHLTFEGISAIQSLRAEKP